MKNKFDPRENLKNNIIRLKMCEQSNKNISLLCRCSESTVYKYLSKNKRYFNQKFSKNTIDKLFSRHKNFIGDSGCYKRRHLLKQNKKNKNITFCEFLSKLESRPLCEITGIPIIVNELNSYSFDHKIAISLGGDASLSNCQVLLREVDQIKKDYPMKYLKNLGDLIFQGIS